jgi:hypothetical protein
MDGTAARRLATLKTLNQQGRRAIATLPPRERAMMLMRGTFGSRPRTFIEVARTFRTTCDEVRMVEGELFHLLGKEWSAEWREAREATYRHRRTPYERRTDFDYVDPGSGRRVRPMHQPLEHRGCGASPRRRGSRRGAASRIGARGDPDDPGDEPHSRRRLPIGGRR